MQFPRKFSVILFVTCLFTVSGKGQDSKPLEKHGVSETMKGKVSEIDFEYSASSVLCMRHRIVLRPDNAEIFTERCRNASRTDRTTFCEVKEGRISQEEFAKLAQLLEQNSFFTMQSEYWGDVTDAVFESTRAKRDGETHEVINYADAGPLRLWTIQRAIEGAALNVDWQMATTRPKCPHWNDRVTKRP